VSLSLQDTANIQVKFCSSHYFNQDLCILSLFERDFQVIDFSAMPSKQLNCEKNQHHLGPKTQAEEVQTAHIKHEENECFVLSKEGLFSYETRHTPALPSDRHVLVQVIATGLCGSDVIILPHAGWARHGRRH
jgi:hypothetical protein